MDKDLRRLDDQFIHSYVKKNDRIIDIGANIGSLAVLAAIKTGQSGTVYAFEPHPRMFHYLTKHVRLNNLRHVECFNIALERPVNQRIYQTVCWMI